MAEPPARIARDWSDLSPWHQGALIALSEGICPEDGSALRLTGWCVKCRCWWSADHQALAVITRYPDPPGWPGKPVRPAEP
jgi:hypothetical protein